MPSALTTFEDDLVSFLGWLRSWKMMVLEQVEADRLR